MNKRGVLVALFLLAILIISGCEEIRKSPEQIKEKNREEEICDNGLAYGECSQSQPDYCDEGNLTQNCQLCSCPSSKICQEDGTCKPDWWSSLNLTSYRFKKYSYDFKNNLFYLDKSSYENIKEKDYDEFPLNKEFLQSYKLIEKQFVPSNAKYDGFLIRFKELSLIEKDIELEKDVKAGKKTKDQKKTELKEYKQSLPNLHSDHILEIKKSIPNFDELIKKEFYNIIYGVVVNIDVLQARKLEKLDFIEKIYPNYEVKHCLNESIPLINVDDVWGQGYTGENITIAIIDTGIDYTHPELGDCTDDEFLSGNCEKVIGGYDIINNDSLPNDNIGHGTHCAGIVAGEGEVYSGVAPDATLLSYKIFEPNLPTYGSTLIEAIEQAIDPNGDGNYSDRADIISMSLGAHGDPDDPQSQAVDNAVEIGSIVVVSAGNSGPEGDYYCKHTSDSNMYSICSPGTARKAITVGASDKQNTLASFSSQGPTSIGTLKPDLLAPGAFICSAQSSQDIFWQLYYDSYGSDIHCGDDQHIFLSGTSMSAPHISGAAALMKQAHPNWTPNQIKYALRNTALDLGYDYMEQGYGRVDVLEAINLEHPPIIATLNTHGEIIGPLLNIMGSIEGDSFESYSLEISEIDENLEWELITESYEIPTDNILFPNFDISNLNYTNYYLRLKVFDVYGNFTEDITIITPITSVNINYVHNDVFNNIFNSGDEIKWHSMYLCPTGENSFFECRFPKEYFSESTSYSINLNPLLSYDVVVVFTNIADSGRKWKKTIMGKGIDFYDPWNVTLIIDEGDAGIIDLGIQEIFDKYNVTPYQAEVTLNSWGFFPFGPHDSRMFNDYGSLYYTNPDFNLYPELEEYLVAYDFSNTNRKNFRTTMSIVARESDKTLKESENFLLLSVKFNETDIYIQPDSDELYNTIFHFPDNLMYTNKNYWSFGMGFSDVDPGSNKTVFYNRFNDKLGLFYTRYYSEYLIPGTTVNIDSLFLFDTIEEFLTKSYYYKEKTYNPSFYSSWDFYANQPVEFIDFEIEDFEGVLHLVHTEDYSDILVGSLKLNRNFNSNSIVHLLNIPTYMHLYSDSGIVKIVYPNGSIKEIPNGDAWRLKCNPTPSYWVPGEDCPVGNYQIMWDTNNIVFDQNNSISNIIYAQYTGQGVWEGNFNLAPNAIIDSPQEGDVFLFGEEVLLNANSSFDPNNESISYFWEGERPLKYFGKITYYNYSTPGEKNIKLYVQDGIDWDSVRVSFNIIDFCLDGTQIGNCSITKPKYCNNQGELINNCQECGCPLGKTCQQDGSCRIICQKKNATIPQIRSTGEPEEEEDISKQKSPERFNFLEWLRNLFKL